MPDVLWLQEVSSADVALVGGKASSLGELIGAGLPVPAGFAVTTEAYVESRDASGRGLALGELLTRAHSSDLTVTASACEAARELVRTMPIARHIDEAIRGAYRQLGALMDDPRVPVAVRSSATGEDSPDASFAGEHDTYLWVCGEDDVVDAVRSCWASLFTARAVSYRTEMGLDHQGLAMGVVVQAMVRPVSAGVAFTLNPSNGDRSVTAVDSSWGFGEAVVSGEVTPDSFLVDKVTNAVVQRVISDKRHEFALSQDSTVARVSVPRPRSTQPSLDDREILEVARLARACEGHAGCPQDVEWAVVAAPGEGTAVVLLQTRPETVWSRFERDGVVADEPRWTPVADLVVADRFRSPFDVETPPGAEGWRDLYTYSTLFSEGRRESEEAKFWFQDGVHWPDPLPPWDATLMEFALAALSQYNTRQLLLPSTNGIEFRVLNGYVYLSPVGVRADEIEARALEFAERADFYYTHWDELYQRWMGKITTLVDALHALRFEPLPDVEDVDEVVRSGSGVGSGFALLSDYRRLVDLAMQLWQYHFEFLNLGYAAYLDYFGFCKSAWPSIPDLSIATMVAGVDVDLFRPDDELKKLARLAVTGGLAAAFDEPDAAAVTAVLEMTEAGRAWLAAYQDCSEPWFNFSTGSGFYHSDCIWIESPDVPFGFIRDYIARLQRGEVLARPVGAIRAERDRLVEEYVAFLPDEASRREFRTRLDLARTVFPYVENHNFYVEHWCHSVIWRRMRELGGVLADRGFWPRANDIFYLKRTEVEDALWDYYAAWATPSQPAGPAHWPTIVERRRAVLAVLRAASPDPALGAPPEVVTEPFTIMLWGITSQSVSNWLGGTTSSDGELTGFAASPGLIEGTARVIMSADQISDVQDGEILVAPLTAPSWAPLFGRIAATVTDTGGIMSHAAIVCREYGLPAVTGTGVATTTITTGMRLRVDGARGTVTILG